MCYIGIHLEQSRQSDDYNESPQSNLRHVAADSITYRTSPLPPSESHFLNEYVLPWGFRHLSHVSPGNRAVLRAVETLHSNAQRHPLEWDRLRRRYSAYLWPALKHDFAIYILITYAPARLLRSFIGRAQLKLKDGTNPLIYAAAFGEIEHARILLSSGVSLHRPGLDVQSDHRQILPLEAAAREGCFQMVDLCLDEGSPVPPALFVSVLKRYCGFPAHIVSRVLQTDEFVEWAAVDAQDEGLLLRALHPRRYAPNPSQQDIHTIQRRLVQIGCNPSTRFNETCLRHAVSAGHISDVQHMLSLGIPLPPDIILNASRSASNVAIIRLCLSKGSDIHAVSFSEDTALHLAISSQPLSAYLKSAEEDNLETVQVLIDAGCNTSLFNLAGETPFHLAVGRSYFSLVEYLLVLRVPLPPDILLSAAESLNASMIRLITSEGADVYATAANGDTPLHRVLYHAWADSEEQLNCIKVLVDSGCNPGLRNAHGKTSFDIAAENGYLSAVQYLYGTLDSTLRSDILLSVAGSNFLDMNPVMKFFIDMGASVHVTRPNGDTLLHLAIMAHAKDTDCFKRVQFLVNAGCDPRACNLASETPFHFAAKQGFTQVMEYLFSLPGVSVPPDVILTLLGDPWSIKQCGYSVYFLLGKGGDAHTVAKNGDTLLHLAAKLRKEEESLRLVKHLVDAECMPSALNSRQETPLHIAAQNGHLSVVQYFLSLNMTLPSDILLAAMTGHSRQAPFIRYLVEKGANVSVTTSEGDAPLHLLLARGEEDDCLECIKFLIDAGCSPYARNSAEQTPFHVAARSGFKKIMEYLISQGVLLPQDILLACEESATLQYFFGKGLNLHSVGAIDLTNLMHRVLDRNPQGEGDPMEFARILVGVGWDPLLKSSTGETAIHAAARTCRIDVIKFFLSQNIPLPPDVLLAGVPSINSNYWRADRFVPLISFLVREGARVDVAATDGDTPLHLAITRNFTPNTRDSRQRDSWKAVEILLNSGADPYARNSDGQTPLGLAEAKGHFFKENFLRLVRNAEAHRHRS